MFTYLYIKQVRFFLVAVLGKIWWAYGQCLTFSCLHIRIFYNMSCIRAYIYIYCKATCVALTTFGFLFNAPHFPLHNLARSNDRIRHVCSWFLCRLRSQYALRPVHTHEAVAAICLAAISVPYTHTVATIFHIRGGGCRCVVCPSMDPFYVLRAARDQRARLQDFLS